MNRIIALCMAVAVGMGVAVATATPAEASLSSCSFGYACLWGGDNWETGTFLGQWTSPRGTCVNLPAWANDKANSFYNRLSDDPNATRHIQVYKDANCTGPALRVYRSGSDWWIGPFPPTYHNNFLTVPGTSDDNIASSIWFNSG